MEESRPRPPASRRPKLGPGVELRPGVAPRPGLERRPAVGSAPGAERPSRDLPGSQALRLLRDPFRALPHLAARRGDVAAARLGPRRAVLVASPQGIRQVLATDHQAFTKGGSMRGLRLLLGDGLITSEGDRHARQRRLVQHLFARPHRDGWLPAVVEAAVGRSRCWDDGQVRDAQEEMVRLSLDVTTRTLFSEVLGPPEADDLFAAVRTTTDLSHLTSLPAVDWLVHGPLPPFPRFRAARATLRAWAERTVERHLHDPGPPLDVAGAIVRGGPGAVERAAARDQVITFLMAATVTTGHALAWALHCLATHPPAQEALAAEANLVLGGRRPDPEDLPRLPYARAVFAETLRLFPPAWVIGRQAATRTFVQDVTVRRADLVLLSPWVTQRDARWFEAPDAFRPERWLGEAPEPTRFTYFPFGVGPRRCVGEPLAWFEGTVALSVLAARWRFAPTEARPPRLRAGITLAARAGLPLRVTRREAAAG